ncbi:MAG: type II toxin-antitoxin system prevent-host-death family antitoxin [Candidatus Gottesmanbacteria bacterium]|nr:type II toxin-antitoxin system prevent-host-death family antitoxin [Candidatus Gottesmanbacteria bacterium]
MMSTNIISSTDVQRKFTQVLAKLRSSDEPLVVVRDSVPEAVMMAYSEYQELTMLKKQLLKKKMEEIWDAMRIKNADVSDEELNADIERAKRYAKRHR